MKRTLFILFILSFISICSFSQETKEATKINWPDEYHWKVGSDQENESQHLIEMVPGNETIDSWKTLGTMQTLKGVVNFPIAKALDAMFGQAKKMSPDAKLTFYEKDEGAKAPWIIFKIESPSFTTNPMPESQLFYVVQGKSALYINFVAIKEKSLPDDFVTKWIAIFKSS